MSKKIVKIVFFGDSITFGEGVNEKYKWTTLVNNYFSEKLKYKNKKVYTINKGINGNTTRMALERMPSDVQNLRPDIVLVQFGMNDCNYWLTDEGVPRVSEKVYYYNYKEIIDRCLNISVKKVICITNHMSLRDTIMLNGVSYQENNEKYNDILKSLIEKEYKDEQRVEIFDMASKLNSNSYDNFENLLISAPDLLHLSEKGHKEYFKHILPLLEKMVEECLIIKD